MRLLINGTPPQDANAFDIRMQIVTELLASDLDGDQVTEIITSSKDDAFTQALQDFCESTEIAFRMVDTAEGESVQLEINIEEWEGS